MSGADSAAQRALSFGQVAELYDRRRPGYPDALLDDLLGAVPGARRALEAGCGTGRATVAVARRGVEVVACEPDPEMAAVARRVSTGLPVIVHQTRFEEWPGDGGHFDLVVSAQAWHWVDFERGVDVARRVLRQDGALAVWWNRNGRFEGALRDALDDAYRRIAPELARDFAETPAFAPGAELEGFSPMEVRSYDWEQEYDAASFVEYLQTHSDHILLDPGRRAELAGAVSDAIEGVGGGRLVYPYRTWLLLARRR